MKVHIWKRIPTIPSCSPQRGFCMKSFCIPKTFAQKSERKIAIFVIQIHQNRHFWQRIFADNTTEIPSQLLRNIKNSSTTTAMVTVLHRQNEERKEVIKLFFYCSPDRFWTYVSQWSISVVRMCRASRAVQFQTRKLSPAATTTMTTTTKNHLINFSTVWNDRKKKKTQNGTRKKVLNLNRGQRRKKKFSNRWDRDQVKIVLFVCISLAFFSSKKKVSGCLLCTPCLKCSKQNTCESFLKCTSPK